MASSVAKHTAVLANKRDAAAVRPLFTSIRTGETSHVALANELRTDHGSFKTAVDTSKTLTDELRTDHGSFVTAVDTSKTLTDELRTDHGSFKTAVDTSKVLTDELRDDHGTFKTVVDDLKTLVNNLRSAMLNGALGNPTFGIDTNFDVKNTVAIYYTNDGRLMTLTADTSFDTGAAQVIAINKWSAALLSLSDAGAAVLTWSETLNADSEAEAIAALPALPTNNTPLGYVTVLTGAGVTWTAGTDALEGGAGGTASADTNYYNSVNPAVATIITAAVATSSPDAIAAAAATAGPAGITAAAATAGPATISAAALTAQLEA